MRKFRFQDLEIWRLAIQIGDRLYDLADKLESEKKFRFAEQLRGAALSISNNIAEGSGCDSNKEFSKFLNYARRSCYEDANMLIVFHGRGIVEESERDDLLSMLDRESRMIESFKNTLRKV